MEDLDLSLNIKDYKLNIRAAGIIIHNGKILLHKNSNEKFYALIGGRIKAGEDSIAALKREIKEEMGKDIEKIGYVSTIENFFKLEGKKYHEIMFVYNIDFLNNEDKNIEQDIKNVEGKEYLTYEWKNINELDKYLIEPKVIKEILKEKVFPVHKINIDE